MSFKYPCESGRVAGVIVSFHCDQRQILFSFALLIIRSEFFLVRQAAVATVLIGTSTRKAKFINLGWFITRCTIFLYHESHSWTQYNLFNNLEKFATSSEFNMTKLYSQSTRLMDQKKKYVFHLESWTLHLINLIVV